MQCSCPLFQILIVVGTAWCIRAALDLSLVNFPAVVAFIFCDGIFIPNWRCRLAAMAVLISSDRGSTTIMRGRSASMGIARRTRN